MNDNNNHPLQIKKNREALETLRRPTAGQQGGCRGGSAPPPNIILSLSLMIIIIIIKIKRPNGEALETSLPANGRLAGGLQGEQRPPAQHYSIIIIIIIIINYDNYHYSNQATEWRSARGLSAGQRPASRGARGAVGPPPGGLGGWKPPRNSRGSGGRQPPVKTI